ncbi:MAG: M15 family metallopeptidase [Eubacteriales bacterium]|nr:M15 family metallopeptidase [Eubacteriales bacterium]
MRVSSHAARRRRRSAAPLALGLLVLTAAVLLTRLWPAAAPTTDIKTGETVKTNNVVVHPEDAWMLTLVNADHPIEGDPEIKLTTLKNGHSIDTRAYPSLQRMMDDARAAGLSPLICSSYRTTAMQTELFRNKVSYYTAQGNAQAQAEELAAHWVARPGTSEHQLGLAVDIVAESYQLLDEQQEQTAEQQWLIENCADYGFILRYPTDKSELTGVGYEPWHYRYVGETAAKEIMAQDVCLEEYLGEAGKTA